MNKEYLTLLSEQYPRKQDACAEIIKLQSTLCLPKLTEHFLSDIHGEYKSFLHILKNASGVIKYKISGLYGKSISINPRLIMIVAGVVLFQNIRAKKAEV